VTGSTRKGWTLAIVSIGLFMVVLDNLVVNVALPSIHRDLGASIQALEWIVNAYVLAYAVLLLTGAALGDRFGRKRMFLAGLSLFTLSSAAAALAPSTGLLIAARASQGVGAAIVTPLTLTLMRSRPSDAGSRSASGRGSAGPRSRSGRSSAGRSSRRPTGTGSSGSTYRLGSC
jgi:MFS family permease